jgi:hypothetical protein
MKIASPRVVKNGLYVIQSLGRFASHDDAYDLAKKILLSDDHVKAVTKAIENTKITNRFMKPGVVALKNYGVRSYVNQTSTSVRNSSTLLKKRTAPSQLPKNTKRRDKNPDGSCSIDPPNSTTYIIRKVCVGDVECAYRLHLQTKHGGELFVGEFGSEVDAESRASRLVRSSDPCNDVKLFHALNPDRARERVLLQEIVDEDNEKEEEEELTLIDSGSDEGEREEDGPRIELELDDRDHAYGSLSPTTQESPRTSVEETMITPSSNSNDAGLNVVAPLSELLISDRQYYELGMQLNAFEMDAIDKTVDIMRLRKERYRLTLGNRVCNSSSYDPSMMDSTMYSFQMQELCLEHERLLKQMYSIKLKMSRRHLELLGKC